MGYLILFIQLELFNKYRTIDHIRIDTLLTLNVYSRHVAGLLITFPISSHAAWPSFSNFMDDFTCECQHGKISKLFLARSEHTLFYSAVSCVCQIIILSQSRLIVSPCPYKFILCPRRHKGKVIPSS